jgi:hypothetical protein
MSHGLPSHMRQDRDGEIEPPWAASDQQQWQAHLAFQQEMAKQWTCVYRSWGSIKGFNGAQYSALLPASRVESALANSSWEVHIGDGGYGFSQGYEDGATRTTYERFPDEGAELLVICRTFHGIRPDELELVEEFRLLFNLWEDRATRTYYYFDDAGNAVKAAAIEPKQVRVLSSLLRRYLAAKQLYLALYSDSTHFSTDLPDERGEEWKHEDGESRFEYFRELPDLSTGKFSRLLGKRVLAPPPREECDLWPFERTERFESFIIGATPDGQEVIHTSEPDQLANYFGANPDSPHYLTPVYFRREVLNKYYAEPDRYSVEDGYLRCAGLWGLRLDNDQPGDIMVFLGDLGRDIPFSEAQYWKSFNIAPPEEGPSETLIRRAFGAEFADPKSADLKFSRVYGATNEAWNEGFGAPLFKPLHEDDRHVLSKLHTPVGDGQAEFDEQVLYLAKLLVDSLNEDALTAEMAGGPRGEKGLAKLQRFLENQGVADARTLLKPLAEVQGLRSRSAAHRKGSSFDITVAIGELGRRNGFDKLLEASIVTLEALKGIAAAADS